LSRAYAPRRVTARTPERTEAFLRIWGSPECGTDYDRVLAALNAIGGAPYLTRAALVVWRSELGLQRARGAAAQYCPPPPSGAPTREADGFVGAIDNGTKEGRARAIPPEPITWSALVNYATANHIPTHGTPREVAARVNRMRAGNGLTLWHVIPDRGRPEPPFPVLSVSKSGFGEALVVRAMPERGWLP
jgi:hypothetical protein